MSRRPVALHTLGSLFMTALVACSDPAAPTGKFDPQISMTVLSGENQHALEYTELPEPIVIQVLNAKGKPVSGQVVNFRVVQGGGSVYAGAAVTDNQGKAREWWTVGDAGIRNLFEARAVDPSTGAQMVLGTVLAFPEPLIEPIVQYKCGNQADWVPPNSGPLPGECYGTSPEFVPRQNKGDVIQMQVRVVHGDDITVPRNTPVQRMWLDFYAFHNSDTGTPPSVTPVYGVTNSLGVTALTFTIGQVPVANDLLVFGPVGYFTREPVVTGVQSFFVRP